MGFSRREYWSGLPFPSPGDLLDPGIEPKSPTLQADSLPSEPAGKPHELHIQSIILKQYDTPRSSCIYMRRARIKKQVYDMLKETSLVVQWLRLCASNAGGTGLIPGRGTKIPYVMWHSQKIKKI